MLATLSDYMETLIESPASLSPALNETPPGQHIKLDLCTTSVMNIRGGRRSTEGSAGRGLAGPAQQQHGTSAHH